jgi:hypothetical protein
MKKVIRLTESDLIRIVKRVIKESKGKNLMEDESKTFIKMNLFIPLIEKDGKKSLDYNGEIKFSIPKTKMEQDPNKTGSWWDGKKVKHLDIDIAGDEKFITLTEIKNDNNQISGVGPRVSEIVKPNSNGSSALLSLIGKQIDGTKNNRTQVIFNGYGGIVYAVVNFISKPTQ